MPSFSRTISGLTPNADVILYYRPTTETGSSKTGTISSDGEYTVSFTYEYDVEYIWALYYYENNLATTEIARDTILSPIPVYELSCGDNAAHALISNLLSGDVIVFSVYKNGALVDTVSRTLTGSTSAILLSIDGLDPGTTYTAFVTVNDMSLGFKSFTTTGQSTAFSITDVDADSVTVTVSGVQEEDEVELRVLAASDTTVIGSTTKTVGGSSDGSISITVNGLHFGTEYRARVYVNNKNIGTSSFTTTLDVYFDWDTNIYQHAKMATRRAYYLDVPHPAPVTAVEWNRLVEIVNAKCGTSISYVSAGDRMRARDDGDNVREVADALSVSIPIDYRITAKFFLDLKDAINDM